MKLSFRTKYLGTKDDSSSKGRIVFQREVITKNYDYFSGFF